MSTEAIVSIVNAIKQLGIVGQQAFIFYVVLKFIPIAAMCLFAFYVVKKICRCVDHYHDISNIIDDICRRTGTCSREELHLTFYEGFDHEIVDKIVNEIIKINNKSKKR